MPKKIFTKNVCVGGVLNNRGIGCAIFWYQDELHFLTFEPSVHIGVHILGTHKVSNQVVSKMMTVSLLLKCIHNHPFKKRCQYLAYWSEKAYMKRFTKILAYSLHNLFNRVSIKQNAKKL